MRCRLCVLHATQGRGRIMAMDFSKFRDGQNGAFRVAFQRLIAGEKQTGIIGPTGYGKSDLIRALAFEAWDQGWVCGTLVLSPNEILREQMVAPKKMARFASFYTVRTTGGKPMPTCASLKKYSAGNLAPNGEFLLSATIQLIAAAPEDYIRWIESTVRRTGKPLLLIMDECHFGAVGDDGNTWGRIVERLRDAGCHLIVLTATAEREDGEPTIGFRTEVVKREPVTVKKIRKGSTPEKIRVELYSGEKIHYNLVADYQKTFKDAWDEGVLCRLNYNKITVSLAEVFQEQNEERMLTDLSPTEVRQVLGELVRDQKVIAEGCRMFLELLRKKQAMNPACVGLIFTANDIGSSEANQHAEQIKRELLRQDPNIDARVITTTNDGSGASGIAMLGAFVCGGAGEVGLLKQMGGIGLDCVPCKLILDLSPTRAAAAFIQRLGRAMRPFEGILVADVIGPDDVLFVALWERFIESQGGSVRSELEFVSSEEKDRQESNPRSLFEVDSAQAGDVLDTNGEEASCEDARRAVRFANALPEVGLLKMYTVPQVVQAIRAMDAPEPPTASQGEGFRDTTAELVQIKEEVTRVVKPIIMTRITRDGKDPGKDYKAYSKSLWGEIYGISGYGSDYDYQTSRDLGKAAKIRDIAKSIRRREVGW